MTPSLRVPRPILAALGLLLLMGSAAFGPAALARQSAAVPLIDVVVIVDDSGSMTEGDHPSDPTGLRYAAARLLVDLARSGDRVDVISFNDDVRVFGLGACTLHSASDHSTTCPRTTVGESNRAALRAQLQYDGRHGNTRMDLALAMARNLLRSSRDGRPQYALFLTDGVPYPADQLPALYQVIDELGADGVQVFPILLGTQTSDEVTNRLVQRTNGVAYPAASAADLVNIFGAIYASIRPNLYVSVLDSDTTGYLQFFTNDTQGITDVTMVLPRQNGVAVYSSLALNGTSLTGCQPLANGVAVSCLQPPDPFYDRFRLTHNQAISGKWTAQLNGQKKALVIVQAQTDLTLSAPPPVSPGQRPSVHWSAARRGEALLIVNPLQGGKPVADLPISVNGEKLDGHAYSLDGTAYWKVVPAPQANMRQPITIQLGQEVAPVVLRQTVYLQAGDFPLLVVDHPQAGEMPLNARNQVRLQAHFETSQGLTEPAVRAVVRDITNPAQPRVVYDAALACSAAGACADENFGQVEFGHNYEVVFVAQARYKGTLYGDFARTLFSTPNQVVVDGLPASGLDLSTVVTAPLPIRLRAVGLGDFCTPQAQLSLHRSETPSVPATAATVEMPVPFLKGGQSFATSLSFAGLAQLPPGQYLGEVQFTCGKVPVAPARMPVSYGITPGIVRLEPNGPLDFGALATAGQTAALKLDLELSSPDLAPHLSAALISAIPDAQSNVVLTTGPVEAVNGTHYRLPLFLTLRDESLPATQYEGKVQISARPGDVLTPPDGVVTVLFNRPAPAVKSVTLLPNGPVDFGLLEGVGQTVIRPVEVDLSDPKTPLTVTLLSAEPNALPGVTLATGPLQSLGGQRYQLPLFLTLQTDLPLGQYHGEAQVAVAEGTVLTPADGLLTVQFKRPTFGESVWARVEPIWALMKWWLWPFSPPGWPAFICWPGLLLAALVGYRLFQNWTFDRELRQRRGSAELRPAARRRGTRPGIWQPPDDPGPAPKPKAEALTPKPQSHKPKAPSEPPATAPDSGEDARRKRYRGD